MEPPGDALFDLAPYFAEPVPAHPHHGKRPLQKGDAFFVFQFIPENRSSSNAARTGRFPLLCHYRTPRHPREGILTG
jgi:hypothetical protein